MEPTRRPHALMRRPRPDRVSSTVRALLAALVCPALLAIPRGGDAQEPLRVFISTDMEGVGGVGTPAMTGASGKDYGTARRLMTDEIEAVVAAIFARGPAEIVINDSHGDHQNVLHTELDPRVTYIQGAVKPLGMVAGLDGSFDAAIFLGYHARAGTPGGFLAHTGSGSVKGLWVNGVEVGEGGMNAAFAGFHGVPVVLAAGDAVFADQFADLTGARTVTTKTAETAHAARLLSADTVQARLVTGVEAALDALPSARPWFPGDDPGGPVEVRMRFEDPIHAEILESVPGVQRVDGYTVRATASDMDEAYRLIRLMYRFVRV